MERLKSYDWPGNIRELQNILENAIVLARSKVIEEIDLADESSEAEAKKAGPRETLRSEIGSSPRKRNI